MNRFSNFAYNGHAGKSSRQGVLSEESSPSWLDVRRPSSSDRQSHNEIGRLDEQSRKIPKKRQILVEDSDEDNHVYPHRKHDTSFPSFTMADMLNKTKSESLQDIIRKKQSPKSKLVKESLLERSLEELDEYDPVAEMREKTLKMNARERAARVHSRSANALFDGSDEEVVNVSNKGKKKKRLMIDSDEEESHMTAPQKTAHSKVQNNKIIDDDDAFIVDLIETPETRQKQPAKRQKSEKNDTVSVRRRSEEKLVFNLADETDFQDALDADAMDDDEEESEREWDEEMTRADIIAKANQVIRQCEGVSKNLRKSLASWQGQAPSTNTESASSSSFITKDGQEMNCINLLEIASPEARQHHSISATITKHALLNNEDIATFCPGLVLNPYQLVGVNWLKLLYENEVNGVLADDMGLGKTVQSIAFMGWLAVVAQNTPRVKRPHLIVVPASVLSNWENELERFCPTLEVVRYHGSQNEKTEMRHELRRRIPLGEIDVILTTYTLFERESNAKDRAFFGNQKFNFLILDEAHSIKNASSSRYNHLNALKTKHRLLLSGTPVQNDLRELLALLSFLMPDVFDKDNCEAMIMAFDWDATNAGKNNNVATNGNGSSKTVAGVSLAQLKAMLAPFVLRRLKRDVLEHLSEKRTELVMLPPAPSQKKIYEDIILSYALRKEKNAMRSQEAEDEAKLLEGKLPGNGRKKATGGKPVNATDENSNKTNHNGKSASIAQWISKKSSSSEEEVIDLSSPIKTDSSMQNATNCGSLADKNNNNNNETVVLGLKNLSSTDAKHLFTALRKAANHPLLLRIHYQDETISNKIANIVYDEGYFGFKVDFARAKAELETFSDFDIHQLCLQYEYQLGKYALDASVLYDSPKMEELRTLLPKLQSEGHRMLIFSQWTRLLDLLEVLLEDMNMEYLRLDGSTPIKERQERIDIFNEDVSIPVFLLSTKAGGLGINLTSADTVILHDLDFNPENDKQAEDRCHRIGQTKPVTVYKLVTQGTVDEDIYEMGERKRLLSQAVLSDNKKVVEKQEEEEDDETDGKSKGKNKTSKKKKTAKGDDEEEDMDAISRILSKALSRQGIQL